MALIGVPSASVATRRFDPGRARSKDSARFFACSTIRIDEKSIAREASIFSALPIRLHDNAVVLSFSAIRAIPTMVRYIKLDIWHRRNAYGESFVIISHDAERFESFVVFILGNGGASSLLVQ